MATADEVTKLMSFATANRALATILMSECRIATDSMAQFRSKVSYNFDEFGAVQEDFESLNDTVSQVNQVTDRLVILGEDYARSGQEFDVENSEKTLDEIFNHYTNLTNILAEKSQSLESKLGRVTELLEEKLLVEDTISFDSLDVGNHSRRVMGISQIVSEVAQQSTDLLDAIMRGDK